MSFVVRSNSLRPGKHGAAFLLLWACLNSCAADTPEVATKDFAFAFQCDEKTKASCLIGEFPSGQSITLISSQGLQCSAKTRDSYSEQAYFGDVLATRLDTSACPNVNFAFAWLAPSKGTVQIIPLKEIKDRSELAALHKRHGRSNLPRFNEKKWREDRPDPDPDNQWTASESFGRAKEEWRFLLEWTKQHYQQFQRPPTAYRVNAPGKAFTVLQYPPGMSLYVELNGSFQLLEPGTSRPLAFSIGDRRYLYFYWNNGEGGDGGTSIWQVDEKEAKELVSDNSFAT